MKYMKNYLSVNIFPFLLVIVFVSPVLKFYFGLHSLFDIVLPIMAILLSFVYKNYIKLNNIDYLALFSIFIILIYTMLSAINMDDDLIYLKALKIILGCTIFLVILINYNPNQDSFTFINSLVLASFFLSIVTLYSPFELVFDNRLIFSFGFCCGALCSIYLYETNNENWLLKIGFLAVFFILLYTLITTGNRGGVLALIVGLAIYFFDSKYLLKSIIFIVITFALFYFIYLFSDSVTVSRLTQLIESGDETRSLLIIKSVEGIKDTFPLGAGFDGNFKYLNGAFPHNIILELLLTYGVVAIPCIFVFIYSVFKPFISSNKQVRLFHALFIIIFLNFLKSHSLTDIRFFLIPLALSLVTIRYERRKKIEKN